MSKKLFDSSVFWVAMGGAVIALGGIGVAIGAINLSPQESPREPWFVLGVGLAGLGGLMLAWALVLFVAHRYAESHPVTVAPAVEREKPEDTPAAPVTPLERLRELRRETAELHVVINEAQGHRMHAEARQQIIAWVLRVEPVLYSQDEELWKMFHSAFDPPPELLDRSIPQPAEMTDEQWERNWDMQDSNILRSFLRRKEEALGRAISRLLA